MTAGKARISMACLQDGYPHLAKSLSYNNGWNSGYGSLGIPPDPAPYDVGTLVQPVGVLIQFETAIGAGAIVKTLDLGALGAESLAEELMVLMALSKLSWFLRRLLLALAFQRQRRMIERHISVTTPRAEAPDDKLAHWKLSRYTSELDWLMEFSFVWSKYNFAIFLNSSSFSLSVLPLQANPGPGKGPYKRMAHIARRCLKISHTPMKITTQANIFPEV